MALMVGVACTCVRLCGWVRVCGCVCACVCVRVSVRMCMCARKRDMFNQLVSVLPNYEGL